MQTLTRQTRPDRWIDRIIAAKAAQKGAVIRRSMIWVDRAMIWVDREIGRDRFMEEVRRRGFRLIETADQFIVICHNGPVRMLS